MTPLPPLVSAFLDDYIHDSAGGFLMSGSNEYSFNWYGVFKYRRIYFGNQGYTVSLDTSKAQGNKATSSKLIGLSDDIALKQATQA